MLPTLGLTKYKNVDLQKDQRNPFRVQQQTEKLLVVREREREFQDFNKLEKEGLRIFEKEKSSRPNRKGVIREIKGIRGGGHHSQSAQFDGSRRQLAINTSQDAFGSQKLNIFEAQDSSQINKEKFQALGYQMENTQQLVPLKNTLVGVEEEDVRSIGSKASSRMNSTLAPLYQKPKAIDYLNKGRD